MIVVGLMLIFFFINVASTMAYDLNEAGQEEEKVAPPAVQEKPAPVILEQPVIVGEGKAYTLGKEDVLQIVVRNQPEFSGQFVIGPDGKIQYSFVGDIESAGLTKEELKEKLIKELDRFVKLPEVSVAIIAYRSKNVYVMGAVGRPGKYPMKGDIISLRDVIIESGMPTEVAALRRVHIIKPDPSDPTSTKVNLYAILYKGKLEDNFDLVPGDIVVVPTTFFSQVTRTLDKLLSPVTKALVVDEIINGGIF